VNRFSNILLWIAVTLLVAAYSFADFIPNYEAFGIERKFYYISRSLFVVLLCLCIYRENKSRMVAYLLLVWSINDLLDELFFNPLIYQWNEYVFAAASILYWIMVKSKKNESRASSNINKRFL
jgi:hypothetical protein